MGIGSWLGYWGALFGYQAMVLWSLAAAIPLLLHLWSRRQRRETPWAAMQFLRAAVEKHSRRWRIEQWTLLALRVAPLALLGLALADPEAPWLSSGLPGRQRQKHLVLIIDTSFSMLADDGPGGGERRSRFTRATDAAREWVAAARPGDGLSLAVMNDSPRLLNDRPVLDKQEMLAELARLECGQGEASLAATASLIVTYVRQLREAEPQWEHELVWLSDFGANTWSEASSTASESLRQLAELAPLRLQDVVASRGEEPFNLTVSSVQVREPLPVTSAPATLEATVQCFGGEANGEAEAVFYLDGQEVGRRRVAAPRGGSQQVALPILISDPGEHWLKVELEVEGDVLSVDDVRNHVVHVRAGLRALCIEGRAGEAHECALALSPTDASPIAVDVASETALAERELAQYDCVVLLNVGRITADDAKQLTSYVQAGGGLVAFTGDLVQADSWNAARFEPSVNRGILPARLLPTKTGRQGLDPLEYRHPVVAIFEGRERAGFRSTPVTRYFPLQPNEQSTPIFATTNGDVVAVDGRMGNGRCLLFGISASAQSVLETSSGREPWSELSQWPSFLPLIQRAFLHVARQNREARNSEVGRPISGYASGRSLLTLVGPKGDTRQLPVMEGRWSFADTQQAGVYRVAASSQDDAPQLRAVNLSIAESDLRHVDDDALPEMLAWEESPAALATPEPSVAFRWLLAMILLLLLAESWYANRLARGEV